MLALVDVAPVNPLPTVWSRHERAIAAVCQCSVDRGEYQSGGQKTGVLHVLGKDDALGVCDTRRTAAGMVQRLRRIRRFSSLADDLGDFSAGCQQILLTSSGASRDRRAVGRFPELGLFAGAASGGRRQSQSALHKRFPRSRTDIARR